jgi:hypothetical protein
MHLGASFLVRFKIGTSTIRVLNIFVFKIFAYLCFVGICPQEPGEKNQKVTLRVCTGICGHRFQQTKDMQKY